MYNLLFCINSRYTELLKVCLSSVVLHSGFDSMSVSIIYSSLRDSEIAEIKKLENNRLKINFIRFDDSVLSSSPTTGRYPKEIYYRLFAPVLLDDDIDRILYLDVDLICINSLVELYNTDISSVYYAACSHTRKILTKFNAVRLGLDIADECPYINTGVLLMNLSRLRKNFDSRKIFDFIEKKGSSFILPDQDIIMGIYGDRIRLVDTLKYNLSDRILKLNNMTGGRRRLTLMDVAQNTSIIHYCGRSKPWKKYYNGRLGVFFETAVKEYRQWLDAQMD